MALLSILPPLSWLLLVLLPLVMLLSVVAASAAVCTRVTETGPAAAHDAAVAAVAAPLPDAMACVLARTFACLPTGLLGSEFRCPKNLLSHHARPGAPRNPHLCSVTLHMPPGHPPKTEALPAHGGSKSQLLALARAWTVASVRHGQERDWQGDCEIVCAWTCKRGCEREPPRTRIHSRICPPAETRRAKAHGAPRATPRARETWR